MQFRKVSNITKEIHIKQRNLELEAMLKAFEWAPSQRKLIQVQIIINELEGKRGREVFETEDKDTFKMKAAKVMTNALRKKYNEAGAKLYVDRLREVLCDGAE